MVAVKIRSSLVENVGVFLSGIKLDMLVIFSKLRRHTKVKVSGQSIAGEKDGNNSRREEGGMSGEARDVRELIRTNESRVT